MNSTTMTSYRPFQKFHPLTLLAQLSSRQANGCLQVSDGSASWSLYLDQGKLLYATNSTSPFDRLDRHLRRLNLQIPSLVSAVRVQMRLLFENAEATELPNDYQAICWLVEQQHLNPAQASLLIEALAVEVIESFLAIHDGSHELIPLDDLESVPQFCQLDLRFLVEQCQTRLRQKQLSRPVNSPSTNSSASLSVKLPNPPQPLSPSNGSSESTPKSFSPPPFPTPTAEATPPTDEAAQPTYRSPAAASEQASYTIACIDDSPTVLQAIRSFLDDKTFNILMIDNPVRALMQIVRSKPDLILLDVTMPNLDGYELCSLLRRHPHFRNTPVIMVTGNTGFIDRAKAKLVGASGYLTKPFTQSDLVKMVFKHLS